MGQLHAFLSGTRCSAGTWNPRHQQWFPSPPDRHAPPPPAAPTTATGWGSTPTARHPAGQRTAHFSPVDPHLWAVAAGGQRSCRDVWGCAGRRGHGGGQGLTSAATHGEMHPSLAAGPGTAAVGRPTDSTDRIRRQNDRIEGQVTPPRQATARQRD